MGSKVRLAVIDHITSMPIILIPVRELVKICCEEGVAQVFVDGAHAIGIWNLEDKDGRITGYARISHQIYNMVEDYYKFRDAMNELVCDGFTCKMLLSLTEKIGDV
ncbi:hypothetical protein HHK36_002110 [Tetracentron sinense]|uniref:Uncharacterized protein n=1 Tax=Tetracentron sinense TaxID=13715 RepID=A0A835A3X7_TETSI|nr:hypothetical protein HHK36_002110 [Tetracentron sinense]